MKLQIDSNNTIFIYQKMSDVFLKVFNSDGEEITHFLQDTLTTGIGGLLIDELENYYIADTVGWLLRKFNKNGKEL